MQKVSQKWKENQENVLCNEGFIEVTMIVTDPEAYQDASAEDNGAIYISKTDETVNGVNKKVVPYATLEKNLWVLDGSREIIPLSDFGDCGYIGNTLSDDNGEFSISPTVSINFSKVFHNLIAGVSIVWGETYNEYAVDFTITVYNGEDIVARREITDNKDITSVVYMDIVDYDCIVINVLKWCLPHRRARITSILNGIIVKYDKSDLFSFEHSQEIDPISASLPKAEISFSIDNTDNSYNPNNLDSMAKYLMERQEILARYGFKISEAVEWVDCGTFYISEWDAPQNGLTAEFKARDLLEFLTGTYYWGVYSPKGISMYALAEDVLLDANLPLDNEGTVKWVIDEKLKDIYTVAPLPVDTHANCLQLIANASGCVIYQDRKGILHIEKLVLQDIDYKIDYNNSYSKSNVTLSKPLKQVEVSSYSYAVSSESSELYKSTINIDGTIDLLINYSGTATNVTASVSKGTINSATYYANVCLLNVTAVGDVTITVTGYTLETSSLNVVTQSGLTGETVSVDNMLITDRSRAIIVGEWVEAYMKNRMILSSEWRADPRLDALDRVYNENDYDTNTVMMTSLKYTYSGSFKGSGEGRVI